MKMKFGSNPVKVSSSKDITARLKNVNSSKSVDLKKFVRSEFEKILTHDAVRGALNMSNALACQCCKAAHEKSEQLEQEHKRLMRNSERQQKYLSRNIDTLCKNVNNYFERLTTLEDIVRDMYRTGIREEVTDILKRMCHDATTKDKPKDTLDANNDNLTGTQQLIKTSSEQRAREEELLRQLKIDNIGKVKVPISETKLISCCCANSNEKLINYKDFIRKYEQQLQVEQTKLAELQKPKSLLSNNISELSKQQSTKQCCCNRSEVLKKSSYVTRFVAPKSEPSSQTDSIGSATSKTLKHKKSTQSKENPAKGHYEDADRRQFLSNLFTLKKSEYTMHLNSLKRTIEKPTQPYPPPMHRNEVDTRKPDSWPQGVIGTFVDSTVSGRQMSSLSKRTN